MKDVTPNEVHLGFVAYDAWTTDPGSQGNAGVCASDHDRALCSSGTRPVESCRPSTGVQVTFWSHEVGRCSPLFYTHVFSYIPGIQQVGAYLEALCNRGCECITAGLTRIPVYRLRAGVASHI